MSSVKINANRLLTATFVSNFGDGMHTLAIGQILYEKTGSVSSFGVIITLNYLFGILCQIYAGPLADRFKRKTLMNTCDLVRGICVLLIALCVHASLPVSLLILLSVLVKVGTHMYRPAFYAFIPEAVSPEMVGDFNSKNVSCIQGGQLLGMAFFGLIYAYGPAMVFLMDASSFFLSAFLVSTLATTPSHHGGTSSSMVADWKEVFGAIRTDRGLLLQLVLSASIFLIYQFETLAVVPLVTSRMAGHDFWLSILQGAFSFGCIFAILILRRSKGGRSAYYWMVVQSLAVAGLLGTGRSGVASAVLFFTMGLASTVASTQLLNRLMERTRKDIQGRIAGFRFLLISILISAFVPPLTAIFNRGLDLGILASAAVLLLFALIGVVAASDRFQGKKLPSQVLAAGFHRC